MDFLIRFGTEQGGTRGKINTSFYFASPSASGEPKGTSNVPSEHLADPYTVVDDPACVGVNTEDMSELDGTATPAMTYQGFLQDSGCERGFSASDTTGITTLRSTLYRYNQGFPQMGPSQKSPSACTFLKQQLTKVPINSHHIHVT